MISYYGVYAKIDLHGLTKIEAKIQLDNCLSLMSDKIVELTISHGYHSGNVLQQFVRKEYRHKRIDKKMISTNPGETIYRLLRS